MNAKLKSLLREKGIGGAAAEPTESGVDIRRDGAGRRRKGKATAPAASVPQDGIVRVGRETKGRKGKGVTVVTGAPVTGDELVALGKELKNLCGAGGTVRAGVIEIQGDHRDRILSALEGKGWTVKRVGG